LEAPDAGRRLNLGGPTEPIRLQAPTDAGGSSATAGERGVLPPGAQVVAARSDRPARRCGKAGVGSAVNDSTRLLGSTLGVAIIGSVYASIYASRLSASFPSALPAHLARAAHDSAGAALAVAGRLASTGHASLAGSLHHAASHAFFGGFTAGCLVAAGVAGTIAAALLLPAHPTLPTAGVSQPAVKAQPAPDGA
jgi:hypothetical protein